MQDKKESACIRQVALVQWMHHNGSAGQSCGHRQQVSSITQLSVLQPWAFTCN